MEFQFRYVAYAESLGLSPRQAMKRDKEIYPGGVMCGFILWSDKKWREWELETNRKPPHTQQDHKDFDDWLRKGIKDKWHNAINGGMGNGNGND